MLSFITTALGSCVSVVLWVCLGYAKLFVSNLGQVQKMKAMTDSEAPQSHASLLCMALYVRTTLKFQDLTEMRTAPNEMNIFKNTPRVMFGMSHSWTQ